MWNKKCLYEFVFKILRKINNFREKVKLNTILINSFFSLTLKINKESATDLQFTQNKNIIREKNIKHKIIINTLL